MFRFEVGPPRGPVSVYDMLHQPDSEPLAGPKQWTWSLKRVAQQPLRGYVLFISWDLVLASPDCVLTSCKEENGEAETPVAKKKKKKAAAEEIEVQAEETPAAENGSDDTPGKKKKKRKAEAEEVQTEEVAEETPAKKKKKRKSEAVEAEPAEETPETPVSEKKKKKKKKGAED